VKEAQPEATVGGAKKQKKRKKKRSRRSPNDRTEGHSSGAAPTAQVAAEQVQPSSGSGSSVPVSCPNGRGRCHHYVHHRPENWNPSDSSDCDVPPSGRHHKKPAVNPKSETSKFNRYHQSYRFKNTTFWQSNHIRRYERANRQFCDVDTFYKLPIWERGIKVELPEDIPLRYLEQVERELIEYTRWVSLLQGHRDSTEHFSQQARARALALLKKRFQKSEIAEPVAAPEFELDDAEILDEVGGSDGEKPASS